MLGRAYYVINPPAFFSSLWFHSPIVNPLQFDQAGTAYTINQGRYNAMCDSTDDWRDQKLVEIAQERNEDFYGKWVSEMIRIAKPGKPVIIEHVSQPKCTDKRDWGTYKVQKVCVCVASFSTAEIY